MRFTKDTATFSRISKIESVLNRQWRIAASLEMRADIGAITPDEAAKILNSIYLAIEKAFKP